MQTLAILFLGVFALGMGACVSSLIRRNRTLQEDNCFLKADNKYYGTQIERLERDLDEEEGERRRFATANFRLHGELNSAHRMLAMTLGRDLENNIAPDRIGVEVGRAGVHYKFTYNQDGATINEVNTRSDEEPALAGWYSSEQASQERTDVP